MAQRSHVPKFGNWDRENVPYTKYFENARKDRGATGAKMFNPNDPEQNPDAFMYDSSNREGGWNQNHDLVRSVADEAHDPPVRASPPRITADKGIQASKLRHKREATAEDGEFPAVVELPVHYKPRVNVEPQRTQNFKYSSLEASSEQSSSQDNSQSTYNHHQSMGSGNKAGISPPSWTPKNFSESAHNFCPSTPGRSRLRGGNGTPERVAAVPKFGAWDETDPTSGDGFTIIFNKVKEQKKIGAAKFPTVPNEPIAYYNEDKIHHSPSRRRSIFCCLLP